MIILSLIVQIILICLFVLWLAMVLEESRLKDLRIDNLMSELHAQKYRTEKLVEVYKSAMDQAVDLVGEVLKAKMEPHYEPTNE